MSSLPTNLFTVSGIKAEPAKISVWVEIELIARSIREAWAPKNEHGPADTYMS